MVDWYQAERVTSAQLVRQFGLLQERAHHETIIVTHHGRDRLILLGKEKFEQIVASAPTTRVEATHKDAWLFDFIDAAYVAFDDKLTIRDMNVVAQAYFGKDKHDLIGRKVEDLLPTFEGSVVQARLAHSCKTGEVSTFEAPSCAFLGQWVRAKTFPHGGGVGCLFTPADADVEFRRQIAELTALKAALHAMPSSGYARLSPRAALTQVDENFSQIMGISQAVLEGAPLSSIVPARYRVDAMGHIERVLLDGGSATFMTTFLTNKGDELPVQIAVSELREEHALIGAVMLVRAMMGSG